MSDLLMGRTAFVTGGARGIGRALVERFAEEGARVMVGDVAGDEARALAEELRERGLEVHATTLNPGPSPSICPRVQYPSDGTNQWRYKNNGA